MKKRTHKFRIWDVDNECWADVRQLLVEPCLCPRMDEKFSLSDILTGDIIIQEYTGINDRNGVEIYEGDIVKYENGTAPVKFGIIGWLDSGWGVLEMDGIYSDKNHIPIWFVDRSEVVGNILENPTV